MNQKSEFLEKQREKVERFKELKDRKSNLKAELRDIDSELSSLESEFNEYFEEHEIDSTPKFPGLGYIQRDGHRIFANCLVEDQAKLCEYFKSIGREDMIKTSIPASTLSTYVREEVDGGGEQMPPFCSVYMKPQIRLYRRGE